MSDSSVRDDPAQSQTRARVKASQALVGDAALVVRAILDAQAGAFTPDVNVTDRAARLVGQVDQRLPGTFANRWFTAPWPFFRDSAGTLAAPTWRLGTVVTAPAAGAALVTIAAVAGQRHRVFGWLFGKEDAVGNLIQFRDGAAVVGGLSGMDVGGMPSLSPMPIFTGTVNTAFTMNPINAGAVGIDYWAAMLVETAA